MNATIILAAISALTAIMVAAITYYTTKHREREAEWRNVKLTQYKQYFAALAETVGSNVPDDARKRYAIAFNTVGLFASQNVIECLHSYQDLTRLPFEDVALDEHDKRLTRLVIAIRRDLALKPTDDTDTFSFHLIAASVATQPHNKSLDRSVENASPWTPPV
jgi:hypothetical protein